MVKTCKKPELQMTNSLRVLRANKLNLNQYSNGVFKTFFEMLSQLNTALETAPEEYQHLPLQAKAELVRIEQAVNDNVGVAYELLDRANGALKNIKSKKAPVTLKGLEKDISEVRTSLKEKMQRCKGLIETMVVGKGA